MDSELIAYCISFLHTSENQQNNETISKGENMCCLKEMFWVCQYVENYLIWVLCFLFLFDSGEKKNNESVRKRTRVA